MSDKRVLVLSQPQGFSKRLRYDTFARRISDFFTSKGVDSKWINSRAYLKEIESFKPTRIITTWPWCVSDSIIGNNQIEFVATDSNLKSAEIRPLVENKNKITAIYVFSQGLYNKLIKYGFDRSILVYSQGFPVEETLSGNYDSKVYKKALGLDKDKIYFMIFGGGEGKSVAKLSFDLNYYLDTNGYENCDILAFTGYNDEEYKRFKPSIQTLRHLKGVFPYMDYSKFKKYLRAADFIIAKPGGGITSEVIALGKPGLYFSSSPEAKVVGSDTEAENAKMIHESIKVANTHLLNPEGDFQYFIPHIKWFLENVAHAKGLAYMYKKNNVDFWRILVYDKKKQQEIDEITNKIKNLKLNKEKLPNNFEKADNEFKTIIGIVLKNGNGNLVNYRINYEILSFLLENLDDDSFEVILKKQNSLVYYFIDFFRCVQGASNISHSINSYFEAAKNEVQRIRKKRTEGQNNSNNVNMKTEEELFIQIYENPIVYRIMIAKSPLDIEHLANRKNEDAKKIFRVVMQTINPNSSNGYDQFQYRTLTRFKTLLTQKYLAMVSYFDKNNKANWRDNTVFDEFTAFYLRIRH